MKMYALRSTKNNNFFIWEQYAEDGWGKYEATVSSKLRWLAVESLPTMFTHEQLRVPRHCYPWCSLKDHSHEDVEIVEFNFEEVGVVDIDEPIVKR